jgi:hypothetical protein
MILACAVYYAYVQSTQIVAGEPMAFLPVTDIFFAIPRMLAGVSIAVSVIILGTITAQKAKLLSQITAAILVLAAWSGVLPAGFILKDQFTENKSIFPAAHISEGYFRPYLGGLFFAAQEGGTVSGVFLRIRGTESTPVLLQDLSAVTQQTPPYSDVLIAQTLDPPRFLSILTREVLIFADTGQHAWAGGFFSWLCFASMGLPLAALSTLSRSGSWKLKNFLTTLFAFVLIVFLNRLYFSLDIFGTAASGFAHGAALPLDIPHAAFNVLLAIIITLMGILATVITAKRNIEDEEA